MVPRALLLLLLPLCLIGGLIGGCTAPRRPLVVTDPDPSVKIPAMKALVEDRDLRYFEQLVEDLDSDDPAVRFYAIQTLQRLTGQTMDYAYFHDEFEREPALQRWMQWLQERSQAATQLSP